jgi:hypothetical protein
MFYYTSERSFTCIYFNQIQVTLTLRLNSIQKVLLHSQDFDDDDGRGKVVCVGSKVRKPPFASEMV